MGGAVGFRATALVAGLCLLFTATPEAWGDDLAPAAGAGVELSVLDRVSNGASETGLILADYFTLGVAVEGSLELAESVRGVAAFIPVLRLVDTDKGFFEGFRWDLGVSYEIDEFLYARGAFRLDQRRERTGARTETTISSGFLPTFGYRTEIDPDIYWFMEGGMPILFLNKVKHLPEVIILSGIEKKF